MLHHKDCSPLAEVLQFEGFHGHTFGKGYCISASLTALSVHPQVLSSALPTEAVTQSLAHLLSVPSTPFLPFTLTADIGYTGEIFTARCIRYKRSILYLKFFHSYPSHMSSFKDIGSYTIPSYFLFSNCRFDTIQPIYQLVVILYVRRLKIQVSINT